MARDVVDEAEVLLVFQPLGTPPNSAIHKYMNAKKVPQLFVATGATKWNDPKDNPWTMGWQPNYQSESQIYAKYILKNYPNGKIAILYQNDDYGKDYVKGLKDGLGAKASMIIADESYETTETTIDNHIVKLKDTGADVLISITKPNFAAQPMKKIADNNWKPLHVVSKDAAPGGGGVLAAVSARAPGGAGGGGAAGDAVHARDQPGLRRPVLPGLVIRRGRCLWRGFRVVRRTPCPQPAPGQVHGRGRGGRRSGPRPSRVPSKNAPTCRTE